MAMLEYENQIFLDAFHEDGLLVMAKGLGIERILLKFFKVYSDPGNLILVVNTTPLEEDFFLEQLESDGVKPMPKVITNEYPAPERQSIYLQGGVLFVTSRILVVDLLTDRVPLDHVTGIIVLRAHKILESCQEAFILRLFRQKNKTGFIKAFSDSPYAFTTGFSHVERVMTSLYVRKLFLWPRFQADIVACMNKHKVDVVELHVQMTTSMTACQTALLDLLNACIKELKRCTPAVDMEEITVENAVSQAFDKLIRLQLDPIWHQLGAKTKQLVSDLKTLRQILKYLTQYDCVTFNSLVNSVRTSEKAFGQNSGWLFLDATDNLFAHSNDHVTGATGRKKVKLSEDDAKESEPILEECPKWQALTEVLKEIEEENKAADTALGQGRVLLAAEDDRTCSQLREYLCEGGESLLHRLYDKSRGVRTETELDQRKKFAGRKSKKKSKGKSEPTDPNKLTLTQIVGREETSEQKDAADDCAAVSSQDAYFGMLSSPVTIIHPLHGCSDPYNLVRTLQEVEPAYVILYDPDMQFVRQLELYRASRPGIPLRVYFLMYTGSTEEQRYLTTLRKEKEAFEFLIREKATMVIPEDREGRSDDDISASHSMMVDRLGTSSRKGGSAFGKGDKMVTQKVIVDMREFRSELPSLIHRRGIDVEPVTIEVGDYILTPDMCVERKSVSDLIGSLNNGRLYNQCVSMCRFYLRPVLLIEFDPNKSFSLQQKYQISGEISINDVTSRLTLLTMHFPKLRILWCQSPYATAELFSELKAGHPQPDAATALTVTSAEDSMEWSARYSHGPQDVLMKMPGINSKNYKLILNKVEDIGGLCLMSEETLAEILGNAANAKKLWTFLHSDHKKTQETAAPTKPAKYGPYKGFKRKK